MLLINKEEKYMKTRIILVGGFLGAGKTTLLWSMAKELSKQGKKVGLISNDQASELVDTAFLQQSGGVTAEVNGSCFCCNFNGFIDAVEELRNKNHVDIIIAEPVGSCTDLSATIMQPLKDMYKEKLDISPLSVLVDPVRLSALLDEKDYGMHESAAYILYKQLEEADYIVINKTDLLKQQEVDELIEKTSKLWTDAKVFAISGKTGSNMEEWLGAVLTNTDAGTHLLDIDYDIYAEGEAVLGWLNMKVNLMGNNIVWSEFAGQFLNQLGQRFKEENSAIGHVKLIIEEDWNFILGNITGTSDKAAIIGSVEKAEQVSMILNARVEMTPEKLKAIVLETLEKTKETGITYDIKVLNCLQPGRPNPTYRYERIVS